MKKFIKSKVKPGNLGPGYRTPDHFKGSVFSPNKNQITQKFNPAHFKIQHKG